MLQIDKVNKPNKTHTHLYRQFKIIFAGLTSSLSRLVHEQLRNGKLCTACKNGVLSNQLLRKLLCELSSSCAAVIAHRIRLEFSTFSVQHSDSLRGHFIWFAGCALQQIRLTANKCATHICPRKLQSHLRYRGSHRCELYIVCTQFSSLDSAARARMCHMRMRTITT